MNVIDLIAIALLVLAVVAGLRSGALPQVGGIVGALGGGALALVGLPLVAEALTDVDPLVRALLVLGGILAAVAIGEALGSTLGTALGRALDGGVLSAADRLLGGLVGAAQAVLIVWLAGGLLAVGPFPTLASEAQGSTAVRTIARVLPPPTEFADELGQALHASGLPQVFLGLEPLPAPPVDLPDDPATRAIAERAIPSVAQIVAIACEEGFTGSGFAIAPGYLVTNAHVVAGADTVRVRSADGTDDAAVVLFDARLDVAVLHVPGLALPALRFATADPGRGTTAAALGYPGGGGLEVEPAAISSTYRAVGRDIYGEARVQRSILELRAAVDRGDSGGPLVLRDGTVGGVVFAESRTNEDVGYALAPTAVAVAVAPAVGRTSPVETGACLR